MQSKENVCQQTSGHWNPYQVSKGNYPEPVIATDDQYEVS